MEEEVERCVVREWEMWKEGNLEIIDVGGVLELGIVVIKLVGRVLGEVKVDLGRGYDGEIVLGNIRGGEWGVDRDEVVVGECGREG